MFSSISPNKYKTQEMKLFVSYVKDDLLNLYDKIESEYSENRDAIIARDFPNIDLGVIKEKC